MVKETDSMTRVRAYVGGKENLTDMIVFDYPTDNYTFIRFATKTTEIILTFDNMEQVKAWLECLIMAVENPIQHFPR